MAIIFNPFTTLVMAKRSSSKRNKYREGSNVI